jgi:hypothetical protein
MNDATEDFFLHGGAYKRTTEVPRPKCCGTCAFNRTGPTVRPEDVTVEQVQAWSADYDGFVCHEPLEGGVHPRCAGWHALFGRPEVGRR